MFENISRGKRPEDVDAEQNPKVRVVVHLVLLGIVAVLAGVASMHVGGSPSSFMSTGNLGLVLVWLAFAAYTAISTYGVIGGEGLLELFFVHAGALLLAIPAAVILMLLGGWLLK